MNIVFLWLFLFGLWHVRHELSYKIWLINTISGCLFGSLSQESYNYDTRNFNNCLFSILTY